jgi:hypothetical protein
MLLNRNAFWTLTAKKGKLRRAPSDFNYEEERWALTSQRQGIVSMGLDLEQTLGCRRFTCRKFHRQRDQKVIGGTFHTLLINEALGRYNNGTVWFLQLLL